MIRPQESSISLTSEDTDFWTLSIENSEISISYIFLSNQPPTYSFDPSLIFHPQKRPLLAVVADGCGLDSDVIGVHWWRHACTRLRRCMTSDIVILSARAARVPLFKLPINIIALKMILKHHNKKYLTYLLAHYWKNFLILSLGRKTFPTDEMGSMYILVCKKTSLYTCTESFRKIEKITLKNFLKGIE